MFNLIKYTNIISVKLVRNAYKTITSKIYNMYIFIYVIF